MPQIFGVQNVFRREVISENKLEMPKIFREIFEYD